MKRTILAVLGACAVSMSAAAQETTAYAFEQKAGPTIGLMDHAKIAFQAKVTPNAPYSGEATTESVMTLADGNRIVRRTTTRIYRDSAGRTRQETVAPDGQVTSVVITDPVAKFSLVLDPRTQTGNRANMAYYFQTRTDSGEPGRQTIIHKMAGAEGGTVAVAGEPLPPPAGQQVQQSIVVTAGAGGVLRILTTNAAKGETTREDLGEQAFDGVLAKGTRTTIVIPAGAVDNELPLRIVSEEWVSPELQVLLMTKHSDPRVGETTYRLANVVRAEPPRSLFEPPAGFTVK